MLIQNNTRKNMKEFTFNTTPNIRFGVGMLSHINTIDLIKAESRILLITDPGISQTKILDQAINSIELSKSEVMVFSEVQSDPPESTVMDATNLAIKNNINLIIGLGGGSSMDVAKLVAVLALEKQSLSEIYGIGNAKGPRLPLILIPTTAGTGSEVTAVSIITTGDTEKMGAVSPILIPDIAILDPEITIDLPPHITAATGIDAMVHAIEAYTSTSTNNNPISKHLSLEALKLMGSSVEKAVHDGSDIVARSNMLLGSMYAGQAFANSPVAAVHALAYPLGGHYKIPHGLSNALVLPYVLDFNAKTDPQKYAEIAPYVFPNIGGNGSQETAQEFIEKIINLINRCGLQQKLREVGVDKESLPLLAKEAMKQTRLLVNNPREVTEIDALSIYKSAW